MITIKGSKKWNAYKLQVGLIEETFEEVVDVKLCDGRILPNRRLTRTFYRLPSGQRFKLNIHMLTRAVSIQPDTYFELTEAA